MRIDRLRLLLVFPMLLLCAATAHAQPGCPNAKAARIQYAVKIDSTPPGATIYIDNDTCPAVGTTPWTGKLNPGALTVIIKAPGYIAESKTFNVAKVRKVQDLFVPLKAQPRIEVRADADKNMVGATVYVDGVAQGQVSGPVVINSTTGRHLVEIKKPDFEMFSTWVDLSATPSVVLTPALKEIPKFGTIVVESDVPDAEVYIDQNKHPDNTTATIENVREGVHIVEVRKNGQTWTKPVKVEANKQVKVRAELNAGVGVIKVLSDTPGARTFIDGIDKGPVPTTIPDVKAGDHIIQVRAAGFKTEEKTVTVTPGSNQPLSMNLKPDVPADNGKLRIIAIQPDADISIDGVPITKEERAAGEVSRSAGDHLIQVRKAGTKEFKQQVKVEAGRTTTVTADLKDVGKLRILSNPPGATVMINGFSVGKTPLETETETGETILRLEMPGFNAFEETLKVEGGDKTQTISRELAVAGKSDVELELEQKGLSSFGARTLPRGRSTVDLEGGYPYFGGARITVGAGRIAKRFGFDATVSVRTNIARSELGLGGRAMLSNAEPFSAGVFTNLYWGSKLFDDSFRNGVTWDAGGIVSLTALSNVTISGRAYMELWSDRHCPGLDSSMTNGFEGTDPINTCKAYKALVIDNMPEAAVEQEFGFTQDDRRRAEKLTGNKGLDFFKRDGGARFLVSIIAEIAVDQHWNVYGVFEGAPFQGKDERALFTNLFSGTMPDQDYLFYARFGLSYKF